LDIGILVGMLLPDEQLADLVVKAGLIDAKKLGVAYEYAKRTNAPLEEAFLEKGVWKIGADFK